jgi:hypothetical protein
VARSDDSIHRAESDVLDWRKPKPYRLARTSVLNGESRLTLIHVRREGQLQVSCQNAQRYTPGQGNGRRRIRPRALVLRLRETDDCQAGIDLLDSIMELLGRYPGEECVSLVIDTLEGKAVELEMPEIRVALSPGLERELGAMPADLSFRIA